MLIKYGPVLDATTDVLPFITEYNDKNAHKQLLQSGDVIIADTAEDEAVGKATEIINVGKRKVVSGLHTIACRPRVEMAPTYLGFYINSETYHQQLYSLMQGVKVLSISKSNIEGTTLCYPTEAEQQKICDLLNLIELRIVKQRQLIEHLKKYKRGVITSILKQKIRFNSGVEKYPEWSTIRLDELGFFFGGLSGKTKDDFEHGDGKFITYLNVFRNTFALEKGVTLVDVKPNEKQNVIQYGDILFTQSSETVEEVGMSSVWLHQSTPYLNSFCMALRPYSLEYINPKYIGYVLRSEQVRLQIMKEGQGISRINLASSRIRGVTLPMPCLEEQNHIVKFMDGIEATEAFHSQLLLQMQSLKSSLLQKLFI